MPPPATASIEPTDPPYSISVCKFKITGGFEKSYENQERGVATTTTSACGYDWVIDYFPAVWRYGSCWIVLYITLASDSNGPVTVRFAGNLVDHRKPSMVPPLEISVIVMPGDKPKEGTAVAPSSDLQKDFGELWRSKRGTDVTFLVSGEPIAAHRCVFAACTRTRRRRS
nr:unnamed protein product [Digitaria exilis]